MNNIFVCGLSGSGKDSVANHFRDVYGFMKLRIADTIKRIICESKGLTFEELEIQKRTNPELRKLHNDVSKMLDGIAGFDQSTLNRLKMLIDGTAFDYQYIPKENFIREFPKVICDCRTFKEAEMLLKAGWTGIFLSRIPIEYRDSTHFTEQNLFFNGGLFELQQIFPPELIRIVFNNDEEFHPYKTYNLSTTKFAYKTTDGSLNALSNVVSEIYHSIKNPK